MDSFLYKLFKPFTILITREKYFMFLVFLDYHLRYIYAEIEYIWGKRQNKNAGWYEKG